MKKNVKIGVLGGIGPESSATYYKKLIFELQNRGMIKSNKDFPHIIINSINAPELIEKDYNKEILEIYLKGLQELESHKPDFIIMVCNTIHFYYKYLQKRINSNIIDIRNEIKKSLIMSNSKNYTVLGTETTVKKGLYSFLGLNYIQISNKDIKIIKDAIFNYNRGYKKNNQKQKLEIISDKYIKKVDRIILGCTELTLMVKNPLTIDTIDIMVNSTIERIKNDKRNY